MADKEQLRPGEEIPGTPYRVIRLLGAGGMGSVYEVEHQELGKRFVLKTLLSELSTRADLVQRLRTEWRALGKLEHPNIVRVSDAGVAQGKLPYFVMERLMGETLGDRLAHQKALSIELALKIAIGVLDALSVAHNIGIIHRDVKPQNIFVTQQDLPKLLDFGIAKLIDASSQAITARGVAVGTPRYMSPEQAAGDAVDARADLYAVGLVLFEMISGTGPYRVNDVNDLFLAHLTQPAPPLSSVARGVSLELDAIVASLLAKSPAERPQSAKVAAYALRSALALYQKPGATPVITPSMRAEVVGPHQASFEPAEPATAAIGEAPTRQENVHNVLQAATRRFDPNAVQSTHGGPTLNDVNWRETVDERPRAQRGSEPPSPLAGQPAVHASVQPHAAQWQSAALPPSAAASFASASHGSTVQIEDRPSAPPSPESNPTRTAAAPAPLAQRMVIPAEAAAAVQIGAVDLGASQRGAMDLGATPPPVTHSTPHEAYRRWLFPAVVVVLAGLALLLTRLSSKGAEPAASSPAVPPVAKQGEDTPAPVPTPVQPAEPVPASAMPPGAAPSSRASGAALGVPRAPATKPSATTLNGPSIPPAAEPAPAAASDREAAPELPPADLRPAVPRPPRKVPEKAENPALPPSGL